MVGSRSMVGVVGVILMSIVCGGCDFNEYSVWWV